MSTVPTAQYRTCHACGKERKSRNLLYDAETLYGYCKNPYICNELHPNSNKNLIANAKEADLVALEDATESYNEKLHEVYGDESIVALIQRLMTHPVTIRIGDVPMARFLAELSTSETDNMTEAIRYCVRAEMDRREDALYSNDPVPPLSAIAGVTPATAGVVAVEEEDEEDSLEF